MQLKNAKDNPKLIKTIISILIVAVMFVPTLYSLIYLGSIWDVYGETDNVPIAFVNLDKPITKNGKNYNLGKDIAKNLKDNNKVDWKFVSYKEAMDGVKGTKYYAVIEIPENFSQNIANAQDGKFKRPEIIYKSNQGKNFVFSQISSKVANSVMENVSESIQKEVSKTLVNNLYDVKNSIKSAEDGSSQLQAGTQKLLDGSNKLSSGSLSAANGSAQLKSGLDKAVSSTAQLQSGTQELLNGSNKLAAGIGSAASGSKELYTGINVMVNGQEQIVNGSSTLVNGLQTLKSNLTEPNTQIPLLVNGASDLNNKTELIAKGAGTLDTSVSQVAGVIGNSDSVLHGELSAINNSNLSAEDKYKLMAAISGLDQVGSSDSQSPINKIASSTHQLSGNLNNLKGGTQQISSGVSSLAAGISSSQNKASIGLDNLISGAEGIQNGSTKILNGLNTASGSTGLLANGLDQLNGGSVALNSGLNTVNNGNISLQSGLNNAALKTGDLTNGLNTLSDGLNTLTSGVQDSNTGANKLKDGLNDGYNKMNNKLNFTSDNMSNFISNPVTLKDDSINKVSYYGEGLAPYMISLSLWIGAMFISVILTVTKTLNVFKSKIMNSFFGKYIVGVILVATQALIVSFALITQLKLSPVNVPEFYIINAFISVIFFSVMYGLSNVMGVLGGAFMFIVLILQLGASGGTFPIETAPAIYKIVNKVVPMTYSVSSLRMTISGINQSVLNSNIQVMVLFAVVFMLGGVVIKKLFNNFKKSIEKIDKTKAA
ncbi:MAG: YhgE/Pip domain-containing protein [Clostridium sp.]|nr:YhgE/Pip domain-containing protein [Clostridium sp.]